jgi:hypothetical protein
VSQSVHAYVAHSGLVVGEANRRVRQPVPALSPATDNADDEPRPLDALTRMRLARVDGPEGEVERGRKQRETQILAGLAPDGTIGGEHGWHRLSDAEQDRIAATVGLTRPADAYCWLPPEA